MMQKRREEHKSNKIDSHDNSIRTKKKGKIKQKPKNSTDDILHHLSSKLPSNTGDISMKSSMLPYMDSYFKIQESMKINDSLSRVTRDHAINSQIIYQIRKRENQVHLHLIFLIHILDRESTNTYPWNILKNVILDYFHV
jgi:hypothetical protein